MTAKLRLTYQIFISVHSSTKFCSCFLQTEEDSECHSYESWLTSDLSGLRPNGPPLAPAFDFDSCLVSRQSAESVR